MSAPVADPAAAPDELDLRDYLRVLRRRKGTIVLSVLVVVIGALVASFLQTPVYEAEAELLLQARSSETLFDPTTGQPRNPERAVQTEIEVIESEPVRRAVEDELGVEPPDVSASVVRDTDVVALAVEHTDPESAALIANTYAEKYIEFRRTQNVNDLLAAAEQIQEKIAELQAQIDAIDAGAEEEEQSERDEASQSVQRDQLVSQQALFRQQLDQLQVGASLKTGGAQVVTAAEAPGSPIRPTPLRSGVLALVVGLVFGVGLAFLFDYLDDSVRDRHDVERATDGLPILGMIPVVSDWKRPDRARIVSLSEPEGVTAESYRALRTSVQFLGLDRKLRALQVTSSTAGEGKTTTITNLAVLFARSGHRVVVVDCDLRRPRLHEFFGVPNEIGFTSAMLGEQPLSAVVHDVPSVEGLAVIPSGPIPPLPSEMLSSYRTGEIIESLEGEYDLVLIDSPPSVPVTDASVLAPWVDGVLVVASVNMTSKRDLHRATEILRQVEAPVMGAVLNQVSSESGYGDRYGYGYGYTGRRAPRMAPEAPGPAVPRRVEDNGNRREARTSPIPPEHTALEGQLERRRSASAEPPEDRGAPEDPGGAEDPRRAEDPGRLPTRPRPSNPEEDLFPWDDDPFQ